MIFFNRKFTAFLLATVLSFSISAHAMDTVEQLQQAVKEVMESTDTTAVGIALIENGKIVWVEYIRQRRRC